MKVIYTKKPNGFSEQVYISVGFFFALPWASKRGSSIIRSPDLLVYACSNPCLSLMALNIEFDRFQVLCFSPVYKGSVSSLQEQVSPNVNLTQELFSNRTRTSMRVCGGDVREVGCEGNSLCESLGWRKKVRRAIPLILDANLIAAE